MAELERDLRALAASLDVPAERDLVPAVRARIDVAGRPRRSRRRLVLVAFAAIVVAIGVAFAVPPARSAILRLFGVESVSIVRVDKLPPVGPGVLATGTRVSLAEAGRMLAFDPLLPDIGPPQAIYVDELRQLLIVLYGRGSTRLRFTELLGREAFYTKLVTLEQHVEPVTVNGGRGLWIRGQHVVSEMFGQPRIAGNALLWEQGPLTFRLEGRVGKSEALRIARSVPSS